MDLTTILNIFGILSVIINIIQFFSGKEIKKDFRLLISDTEKNVDQVINLVKIGETGTLSEKQTIFENISQVSISSKDHLQALKTIKAKQIKAFQKKNENK